MARKVDALLGELDAVRIFAAVAEHQSFRGAANALKLPRSTVSRRIGDLERALDTRLLHRTTRHVTLTDAGNTFLARVRPALDVITDAGLAAIDASTEPRGLVRITMTPSMAARTAPVMLELLTKYPEVRVDIELTDRKVDLVAEGFDIAIRAGELPDSTLVARSIGRGRTGYFASPSYLARRGIPTSLEKLAEHDWIVFSGRSRIEAFVVHKRLIVNSLAVVLDAAISGFGLAWIPESMLGDAVTRGLLVPVMPEKWPPSQPLHVVYVSSRQLAPRVRAAVDLLVRRIVPPMGQSDSPAAVVPKVRTTKSRTHGNHPPHGRKR